MAQNSGKTAKQPRGKGRPFKPGKSGNPGGRPKLLAEVRDLAREYTADAIAALARALRDKSGAVRIRAAEALLERGWGRPTEPAAEPPNFKGILKFTMVDNGPPPSAGCGDAEHAEEPVDATGIC